jgi:hypothetical protein
MVSRRGLKSTSNLLIWNYCLIGHEKLPAFLPLDVALTSLSPVAVSRKSGEAQFRE